MSLRNAKEYRSMTRPTHFLREKPWGRGWPLKLSRVYYNLTIYVLHTNVKDKDKPEDRQGALLKIKCCDCHATYIGETGRNPSTRLTEHKRATRNGDVSNHIADHHLQTKHRSNRLGRCDMYYVFSDYYQRPTLESWFTNWEQTSLNRSQQLPAPYKRLYWRTQAKLITREWLDNRQFD